MTYSGYLIWRLFSFLTSKSFEVGEPGLAGLANAPSKSLFQNTSPASQVTKGARRRHESLYLYVFWTCPGLANAPRAAERASPKDVKVKAFMTTACTFGYLGRSESPHHGSKSSLYKMATNPTCWRLDENSKSLFQKENQGSLG
jgi:hypothetical protein